MTKLPQKIYSLLSEYWGYKSLYDHQKVAIKHILDGKDTLVIFSTGSGKSLCYQLPAIFLEGITIIISPLIALMIDQVERLKSMGISAAYINSMLSTEEIHDRLENMIDATYKIVYMAPERLGSSTFKNILPQLNLAMVAIDEAHCISEWGQQFRPSYRRIYDHLDTISPETKWVALTATATQKVKKDIIKTLHFENEVIVSDTIRRPNLSWWCLNTIDKKKKLLIVLKKIPKYHSGIIYCNKRALCEEIAELLKSINISASAFHAGMHNKIKENIQKNWYNNHIRWIVATNAFGMGIDKNDCRVVIHYNMPYSLEAYFQEAGRAGRDGEKAYPLLLFNRKDEYRYKDDIKKKLPTYKSLNKLYQTICNLLQLPLGEITEKMAYICLETLSKKNNLNETKVLSYLNVMQKHDIIELIPPLSSHIQIQFFTSSHSINHHIQRYGLSQDISILDTLLRKFQTHNESILWISTQKLIQKFRITKTEIITQLKKLQQKRFISFNLVEQPIMLKMMHHTEKNIPLDRSKIEDYRQIMLKKLQSMINYVQTINCREIHIAAYFGEYIKEPCGTCDNCQKRKKKNDYIQSEDLKKLQYILSKQALSHEQLCKHLQWTSKKTAMYLHHLNSKMSLTRNHKNGKYTLKL